MGQGKIHRIDATVIALEIDNAVGLANPGHVLGVQFLLQGGKEGRHHINDQGTGLLQPGGPRGIDTGADHDRPHVVAFSGKADAHARRLGLGRIIDKGKPVGDEVEAGKLGQQAVANGLSGDTGAVGDIENRAGRQRIHTHGKSPMKQNGKNAQ